jgi:hypothetical protein
MAIVQQSMGLKNKVLNDQSIKNEEHIISACGRFKAIMQGDGNFVLYKEGDTPVWSTNTCDKGSGPFVFSMQGDGNLVIYDAAANPTWASNTCDKGVGPYELEMQSDGNLVAYDKNRTAIWSTGTNEEC